MKTLGMIVMLGFASASTCVGFAQAAPEGVRMEAHRGGQKGEAADRLVRVESMVLPKVERLDTVRYQNLLTLKQKRPKLYRYMMLRHGRALRHMSKDPTVADRFLRGIDLTVELGDLADGYHQLSPSEQTQRRAALEDILNAMFELRQEGQRQRLRAMEARLEKARAEIEAQDAKKQEIVQGRLDRVLQVQKPRSDRRRGRPESK